MKRSIILFLLLFFIADSLFAFKYKIEQIEFITTGSVNTSVIEKEASISTDKLFLNMDELDLYLAEIEDKLLNTRLFNSIDFEYYENTLSVWNTMYDEENQKEEIIVPLYLIVRVEETGNFIIAPYPKFDSNKGFEAKLKIRHNNFLGFMTVFDGDLSYFYSLDKKHSSSFDAEFSLPFYIGKTTNSFYSNLNASYIFSDSLFSTDDYAGLLFSFPFSFFSINHAFEQHYTFTDYSYFIERSIFSVPFSIPVKAFPLTLMLKNTTDYSWSTKPQYASQVTFSPFLIFESEDKGWIVNFQKGYSVLFSSGFTFGSVTKEISPLIELTASLYFPFEHEKLPSNIAPSMRMHIWYSYNQILNKGSFIRGILDNEFKGSSGFILNNDCTISLFQLYVDSLFNNEKLVKLNFEMQMSPFVDIAMIISPSFSFDLTTGLTLIVHPLSMKSIQGRISFASNPFWTDEKKNYSTPYEIYIGLGLFY